VLEGRDQPTPGSQTHAHAKINPDRHRDKNPSPPRANRSLDRRRDQNPNPRTNPSPPRPKPKPTVNPTTTRKSTKERGELWRTEGENGEKRESTAERTEKKNWGNEMKGIKKGLYNRLK
jgi:hypothetical protein